MANKKPFLDSKAQTAREWIDVTSYGFAKIAKGLIPLGVGSLGGVEAFAPALLPAVHMSHDFAFSVLAASVAALVPGVRLIPNMGAKNGL